MEALIAERVGPLTVEVHYDDDPGSSPRDWDNLGTLSGYSRESTVFEEYPEASAAAAYRAARSAYGPILALPVKVLRQAYTIVSETDDWGYADGIYYAPLAKVAEEYPGTFVEQVAAAKATLRGELETLNDYLSGNVYGFVVKAPGDKVLSSVWGFVGEDDYALAEGKAEAAALVADLPEWVARALEIQAEDDEEVAPR